jgi:molecular chaperone GrpE (heat shock protein)
MPLTWTKASFTRARIGNGAVTRATEARKEQLGQREQERETKRAEKLEETKKRILRAAAKFKQGETATTIRDRAGLHDREFKPALAELLDGGELLPIEIVKSNRKKPYPGIILASHKTAQE